MLEIYGNLFDTNTYKNKDGSQLNIRVDAICISTNGFCKTNGKCVMGRGCAKTAADAYPNLSRRLGSYIREYGNRVFDMGQILNPTGAKMLNQPTHLVTFPVKPRKGTAGNSQCNVVSHMHKHIKPGDFVPGWAMIADVDIIKRSAEQLVELADKRKWNNIVLPRPGCGAGELKWEEYVRPILRELLDDRFSVITFPSRRKK